MLEANALNQLIRVGENGDEGALTQALRETVVPSNVGALTTTALSTITPAEFGFADIIHRTVLQCQSTPLNLSANNTTQIASLKAYTLPAGSITLLGGVMDGTVTFTGYSGTALGTTGLGTVATTNANNDLTTTEQNVVQAAPLYITSGVATLKSVTTSAPGVFDGSATNTALNLNLTLPALTTTATAATYTGKIAINWINNGDI